MLLLYFSYKHKKNGLNLCSKNYIKKQQVVLLSIKKNYKRKIKVSMKSINVIIKEKNRNTLYSVH